MSSSASDREGDASGDAIATRQRIVSRNRLIAACRNGMFNIAPDRSCVGELPKRLYGRLRAGVKKAAAALRYTQNRDMFSAAGAELSQLTARNFYRQQCPPGSLPR
jgi:hypothetical protein